MESDGSGSCETLASHSLSEPSYPGLGAMSPTSHRGQQNPRVWSRGTAGTLRTHRSTCPQGKDRAGASDCSAPNEHKVALTPTGLARSPPLRALAAGRREAVRSYFCTRVRALLGPGDERVNSGASCLRHDWRDRQP